ncbi:hypothetical protein J1N35_018882 [Gossypium stocksii]|uniref:Reverse transcriptase domain-containing protein n=1 Tax=Gossypium stocksii TaxID=47602 RepID=A0A9D3VRV2_9ROSI|nr:hypothetical protein J1N35_018882 [Gossypium stocksii]
MLELNGSNSMVQCVPTMAGSSSKVQEAVVSNISAEGVHHFEDRESVPLKENTPVIQEKMGVLVEVESLDSDKHLAIVFPKINFKWELNPLSSSCCLLQSWLSRACLILGLIMGDFNAILSHVDKKSPLTVRKRCQLFGKFGDSCAWQDLGYSGPSYTWQRDTLQSKVVEFFEKLYGEVPSIMRSMPIFGFPTLSPSDVSLLKYTITDEEIKRALFDMAPLKAPGLFASRQIDQDLNNTLIVLIPRNEAPEDFSQLKPISLCFVLYKLVMKVIANRFKAVFPKLIYQERSGFIAGHNISDNIILAQEIIHLMRCNRKGRNWMAIKLDLEKAYDRVSWDFIIASLVVAGILGFLQEVIMSAISSTSMQILWNGIPSQKSKPNCGIGQVYPLLPYLFVLCMEWLGLNIHVEIDNGKAKIVELGCESLMIPKEVCDEIERIAREFNWGSAGGHLKMSLVGWNSICQPRARCGLGFRHLSDQNSSFLMKIGFNLVSKKRTRRGIGHSNACTICGHDFEDLAHVLMDCPVTKEVWMLVVPDQLKQRVCCPFEAELWGILDGILILLNKGYRQAIIMTDNLEVAQILEDLDLEDSGIAVLRRTQQLLRSEGEWKIKHTPRDLNLVVDRFAKFGLNWKSSLQVLNKAPKEEEDLL